MPFVIAAVVGAAVGVGITVFVALATRRPVRVRDVLLAAGAGAVGGVVTLATLGGSSAAIATAGAGRTIAASGAGGATAGASEQAGRNVLDDKPILEGVGTATAIGGVGGAVAPPLIKGGGKIVEAVVRRVNPPSTVSASAPRSTGIAQALLGKEGGVAKRGRGAAGGYASVHPPKPLWLEQRFQRTVDEVFLGRSGPTAETVDVRRFLDETYEHVNEVNALVKALGGRARPIPKHAAPDELLGGVHDFGERASVRRVEELIESLKANPPTDRDGNQIPLPDWFLNLPREARAAGQTTIDVGKASPHIAAGLGRQGPPEPFALRLHNLAAHHAKLEITDGKPSNVLIEEVADMVNAMRQPRIYRPEPMPFEKINAILDDMVAKGQLPEGSQPLIKRALDTQRQLEIDGVVNPYHRIGAAVDEPPPYTGLGSVDPRDLGRLGAGVGGAAAAEEVVDPYAGY